MFEKFSNLDVDSAGRGGEYTVQAGFGWTNGVLLWVASNYGNVLVAPQCPDLLASAEAEGGTTGSEPSDGSDGNGNGSGDENGASALKWSGLLKITIAVGLAGLTFV